LKNRVGSYPYPYGKLIGTFLLSGWCRQESSDPLNSFLTGGTTFSRSRAKGGRFTGILVLNRDDFGRRTVANATVEILEVVARA
jgi:hypothetical protein